MPNLFDSIAEPEPEPVAFPATEPEPPRQPDEWDEIDFGDWEPIPPETEAALLGAQKAGVPGWSRSQAIIQKRLEALLAPMPPEDHPVVVQAFSDAYRAARRRKVALAAMEREESQHEEQE